jgi:hypothetical protein
MMLSSFQLISDAVRKLLFNSLMMPGVLATLPYGSCIIVQVCGYHVIRHNLLRPYALAPKFQEKREQEMRAWVSKQEKG